MNLLRCWIPVGLILAAGFCGCHRSHEKQQLRLFAAVSTTEAVEKVCRQFERQTNLKVKIHTASSSTLANQILHGADADVFLTANLLWAEKLQERGLSLKSAPCFGNRLVAISPSQSSQKWRPMSLSELTDPRIQRIAIAEPDSVPAGMYAKRSLQACGIWHKLKPKLIYGPDVRQTLAYVENHVVDVGLVYQTDVRISQAVKTDFAISTTSSGPIEYAISLTSRSTDADAAERLYEFLYSDVATQLFVEHGFTRLDQRD